MKQLDKREIIDMNQLFDFWCSEKEEIVETFVNQFTNVFNQLAEGCDADGIPESGYDNTQK